jgi:hypothetical protein
MIFPEANAVEERMILDTVTAIGERKMTTMSGGC